jgi:hypothetical protein
LGSVGGNVLDWIDLRPFVRRMVEHHGGELAYGLLAVAVWMAARISRWGFICWHVLTSRKRALDTLACVLGAALLPALLAQQAGAQDLSQGYRQLREILRDLKRSQRQGSELTPERQEQKSNTYGVAGIELGQTLDLTSEQYRSFTCSDHAWYKDLSFA